MRALVSFILAQPSTHSQHPGRFRDYISLWELRYKADAERRFRNRDLEQVRTGLAAVMADDEKFIDRFDFLEIFAPAEAEARPLCLTKMQAEGLGALCLGHPATCDIFAQLATTSGPSVLRRTGDIGHVGITADP
jgi:hypothetical protein